MTPAPLTRARELLEPSRVAPPGMDLAPLLGDWVVFRQRMINTGITRIQIEAAGEGVSLRVLGSAEPQDREPDWGEARAQVFADDVAGDDAWAFRAAYEHPFQRVELFGYLNRGVLAVDAGTTFTDGSARSDYFTRELFYRRP